MRCSNIQKQRRQKEKKGETASSRFHPPINDQLIIERERAYRIGLYFVQCVLECGGTRNRLREQRKRAEKESREKEQRKRAEKERREEREETLA